MFTGLVQSLGTLIKTEAAPFGRRLALDMGEDLRAAVIAEGESIAVSGVCLTVVRQHGRQVEFDVVGQTLAATTLGQKKVGDKLNLELSLKAGDALGGHFVQGHVDGVSTVLEVNPRPEDWRITFDFTPAKPLAAAPKAPGSCGVDGRLFAPIFCLPFGDIAPGAQHFGCTASCGYPLAEVPTLRSCTWATIWQAIRMAAFMLPGSARFLPTMSKAVP